MKFSLPVLCLALFPTLASGQDVRARDLGKKKGPKTVAMKKKTDRGLCDCDGHWTYAYIDLRNNFGPNPGTANWLAYINNPAAAARGCVPASVNDQYTLDKIQASVPSFPGGAAFVGSYFTGKNQDLPTTSNWKNVDGSHVPPDVWSPTEPVQQPDNSFGGEVYGAIFPDGFFSTGNGLNDVDQFGFSLFGQVFGGMYKCCIDICGYEPFFIGNTFVQAAVSGDELKLLDPAANLSSDELEKIKNDMKANMNG